MWIFWTRLKKLLIKLKRNHLTLQHLFLISLLEKTEIIWTNLALIQTQGFCKQKNIGLIDNKNLKENHLGIKKLHLNKKGNTLFAKNLLNFIEGNWNFRSERDVFKEENGASDKRNKFGILSERIKGSKDILMVSETKLDESFREGQFLITGFHSPFRSDRNRNGGGIMLTYGKISQPIC